MRLVVGGQLRDVGRPAGGVTDGVEQDLHALETRIAVEAHAELDDLGVDGRPGIPDRLDVELPELAVAPGLRPVVAEHRPDRGQLDRLRPGMHPVLEVGANDSRRGLGPERPRLGLLGPRGEAEELLLDDVGDFADPALEDLGLLEHRGLDTPVSVARREIGGEALEPRPGGRLGRQQVAGAARRSVGGHPQRELSRGPAAR